MGTPAQPYYPQVDKSIDPKVTVHIQRIYPALNDHDKAIVSLKQQMTALTTTVTTTAKTVATAASSSSSGGGSSTNNFPGLGTINSQTGTAYTLQQQDSGTEIQLSNAAPIAVSLNSVITSPFFCFITNLGTSTATLTPTAGTVNGGASFTLLKNSLSVVVFSGASWFASAIPIVPLNTPAVTHEWIASYDDTTGLFTLTQPAFGDISGTVAPGQLPTPTVATLGGVEAIAPVAHEWINQIDTSGVPHLSQPQAIDVVPASSTTGGRPAGVATGFMDFDTTLGIPIWWNGAAWVNAVGTPV